MFDETIDSSDRRGMTRLSDLEAVCRKDTLGTGVEWIVIVKDNGMGIPSDSFEAIFGVFQRIDNSNHIEGTGIGLALCKKIIELHHGHIWVESIVNEGTAFHFTFPTRLEQIEECIHEAVTTAGTHA